MSSREVVSAKDAALAASEEPSGMTESTSSVMHRVVGEEEKVLARVTQQLESKPVGRAMQIADYDREMISLRDQINDARLEDIPPLLEEMERLQQVSMRRAKVKDGVVDAESPYFGRMVLEENDRKREVLIGRGTYLDPRLGLRIVDWRDAPVSRLYYRYEEGDDYDETFGGKEVEGSVLIRRSVSIINKKLRRVSSPQGVFVRGDAEWRSSSRNQIRLAGGQGSAMRAEGHHRPGKLGVGATDESRDDKFLPEITALIDARQFELLTRSDSHLVVIQGGAGSGKTTIGLHRLAYLAFQDPVRFRPDRMLVVVFNDALARYISRVLPALSVRGVGVSTYEDWAHSLRVSQVRHLPLSYCDETPSEVVRFKKHPLMLKLVERTVADLHAEITRDLEQAIGMDSNAHLILDLWRAQTQHGLLERVESISRARELRDHAGLRHGVERFVLRAREKLDDVVSIWADMLTNRPRIESVFGEGESAPFNKAQINQVYGWCTDRTERIVTYQINRMEQIADTRDKEHDGYEDESRHEGIDGRSVDEVPGLDQEDDTLLLLLLEAVRGKLRKGKEMLRYEHIFVDEAQDLSPTELALVLKTVSQRESVTLAGDTAQRLLMDNGFSDWKSVLSVLSLDHVEIEPLKLGYRSTKQIVEFAEAVLGPLRHQDAPVPVHEGAPVERFEFAHVGEAVATLSEALRELMQQEPKASVAVIARHAEQADAYYEGLVHAEVPRVRRVAEQDFSFTSGIDVTDIRQVKGLEFDYVVLVDVSASSYPDDEESRHLLHIGSTRAAHQLWVMATGTPSRLLPKLD